METLEVLNGFRKVGKYCDATLCIGDKEVLVHQNILAACSPVLDKQLSGMSGHARIFLENTDGWGEEFVGQVVEFLYTGELDKHWQSLEQLCNLAVSLTIHQLQRKIKEVVRDQLFLDPSNFFETFSVALKFKPLDLIEDLFLCFGRYMKEILSQEAFGKINVEILSALLENFGHCIQPIETIRLIFLWITSDTINRQCYLSSLIKHYVKLKNVTEENSRLIEQMKQTFSVPNSLMLTFLQALHDKQIALGLLRDELVTLRVSVSPNSLPISVDLSESINKMETNVNPVIVCVCAISPEDAEESPKERDNFSMTVHIKTEVEDDEAEEEDGEPDAQTGNQLPSYENSAPFMYMQGTSLFSNCQNVAEFSSPESESKAALNLPTVEEMSTKSVDTQLYEPCAGAEKETEFQALDELYGNFNTGMRKRKSEISEIPSREVTTRRKRTKPQSTKVPTWGPVTLNAELEEGATPQEEVSAEKEMADDGDHMNIHKGKEKEVTEDRLNSHPNFVELETNKTRRLLEGTDLSTTSFLTPFQTIESDAALQEYSERNHMTCDDCGRMFKTRKALWLHMRVKHSEDGHPCSACPLKCRSAKELERHTQEVHCATRYDCRYCAKSFGREWSLKRHISCAHNGKGFDCSYCGRTFAQKIHLTEHMAVHKTSHDALCQLCGKSFKHKRSLRRHAPHCKGSTSTGAPVCCPECGMEFKKSRYLKQHMASHSTEEPLQCERCGRRFRWNASYRRHVIKCSLK